MTRWGLLVVLVGACAIETSFRPRPPAPPPRMTHLGLTISSSTMSNGLRVVVVNDPSATEASVTVRYNVGAIEDGASAGMAHLVEHLMFQPQLAGQSVFTHLEDLATYFNATTTFDATTYVARAPVSALDKLLEIEAIRLEDRCKTLDDAAFTREREIVANELAQRDQSTEVFRAIHAAVYPAGHPYRQTVGGSIESVRAIAREQVCEFVDRYYAPGNAVLVVSSPLPVRDVDAAIAKMNARISKRAGTAPHRQEPTYARPQHLEVDAPIDEDVLVLAWALPRDPELQAKVRAVAAALPKVVDDEIGGSVVGIELGDRRAPMIGLAVLPDETETFRHVVDATRIAVMMLPGTFRAEQEHDLGDVVFERVKQGAIYNLYAGFEDGSSRDERLASYVIGGLDPNDAIAREVRALDQLSREEAAAIAYRYLAANTPMVVTVKADGGRKRGTKLSLRAPVHDFGQRRTPVDPALADRAAPGDTGIEREGATTQVLSNGLKVVMLPVTAVPTFEARLVFRAGTADELDSRRGVALFAAHTLTWNLRHLSDVIAFTRAGGLRDVNVATDRTTFAVHGLDTNFDLVLAGLRRWVCDGVYDDSAADFLNVIRRATKRVDDQGALTDAWRASLFGANHPYVAAGIARHANAMLTLDDASQFRSAYFTPDNATLIIAGRFDRALMSRWVEYLFKDWSGRSAGHRDVPLATHAGSIAKVDATALVQIRIALQARVGTRAQRLVAANMLSDLARDVRFRLGASYTFDADLAETRLASFYLIAGWVEATRAAAAVALVRDRVAELKKDAIAAARAFVVARTHVLTQLRSRVGSAGALVDRVERDVELSRDLFSDARLAAEVQALTLKDMAATIAQLDLAHATVLMNGPATEMNGAFEILGRTPYIIQPAAPAPAPAPPAPGYYAPPYTPTYAPPFQGQEQRVLRSELTPALTEQPRSRQMLALSAGAALGTSFASTESVFTGYSVAGALGYRYGLTNAIGGYLGVGRLSADTTDSNGLPRTVSITPVDMLFMWHIGGQRRGWGNALFGLHLERTSGASEEWRSAILYGVEGGYDVIRHRRHRVGLSLRFTRAAEGEGGYMSLAFGLSYQQ